MPKIINTTETPTSQELELMPRAGQPQVWEDYRARVNALINTAKTLTVADVEDIPTMKKARETRLILRQLRIDIEKYRKEQGEEALRRKQKLDAEARQLREIIEPLEERLQQQEDFIELENARIANNQRSRRTAELTPFLSGPISVDLGTMPDAEYAALLQDMKDAAVFRKEREEREAQAAKEAAIKLAQEQERIRAENDRLKAEAAAKEAELAKERAANEAKLAAERAEAKRLADIAATEAKKAQEVANAKAASEREAREKAERELAEHKAAEEKAEADRTEAERKAKTAPDRERIQKLAQQVLEIWIPYITDNTLMNTIIDQRNKFAAWLNKKATELK